MSVTNPATVGPPPQHEVHRAAREAWAAGLCPLPTAVDGVKRPLIPWRQYQASRPTLDQIDLWFRDGHPGWGTLCGQVAGNLEMLELEGRAIRYGMWDEFCQRCDEAGVGGVLDRIVDGYSEATPSDGTHLLYRVTGAPVPGNLKVARRVVDGETQVLFETRGEGGFVILAPSGGPVHPSGRSWDLLNGSVATIATITAAEREGLLHVARTFDEPEAAPTVVTPMPTSIVLDPFQADGESWVAELCAELARQPWGNILGRYGFQHHHDHNNVAYWTRAGKETKAGYSATTNAKGTDRLIAFSSSLPLNAWDGNGPATSYDRLDVIAAFDHGGNRMDAARALADRPARTMDTRHGRPALPEPAPTQPLGKDFWEARATLRHIDQAARSRYVAPAAVLGCVLARVAAFTPPSTCLPPTIGVTASLATYTALLAKSGGGKSSAVGCAGNLLPVIPPGCQGPLSLGSGEGVIEAFFGFIDEADAKGKTKQVKRQIYHGVLFNLDEGEALMDVGQRRGSTVLSMLRTAWSGGDIGQANASAETKRQLTGGGYSLGLISLWQPKPASDLLRDAGGGTPQRFVFLNTVDPTVTTDVTPWPGPLAWTPPPSIIHDGIFGQHPLAIPGAIVTEVVALHVAGVNGQRDINPLDSHRELVRLKIAGVLAVLEGRHDINPEDWQLAGIVTKHSEQARAWIEFEDRRLSQQIEEGVALKMARREAIVEDQSAARALKSGAKAAYRACSRTAPDKASKRQIHYAMSSRIREKVSVDDVIAEAESRGWIVGNDDTGWACGDAKPA